MEKGSWYLLAKSGLQGKHIKLNKNQINIHLPKIKVNIREINLDKILIFGYVFEVNSFRVILMTPEYPKIKILSKLISLILTLILGRWILIWFLLSLICFPCKPLFANKYQLPFSILLPVLNFTAGFFFSLNRCYSCKSAYVDIHFVFKYGDKVMIILFFILF